MIVTPVIYILAATVLLLATYIICFDLYPAYSRQRLKRKSERILRERNP